MHDTPQYGYSPSLLPTNTENLNSFPFPPSSPCAEFIFVCPNLERPIKRGSDKSVFIFRDVNAHDLAFMALYGLE